MRLTFYALILAVVQAYSISGYAQKTKLNLDMENSTVRAVLLEIENMSEFRFLYNSKMVDAEREVDVEFKDFTIDKALDQLFNGTDVAYRIIDRQVVLFSKDEPVYETSILQQKTITGTVKDTNGQPLPGVTVVVKGTTQGTITNDDGKYIITNIPDNATLVFSFVGLRTQEITVDNQSTIDVLMIEETIGLDEVVAIGYGTQRKKDMTGSVSHVMGEKMENESPASVQDLLRGNIPGLNVGFNASPKGGGSLLIRGRSSLTADTSPLLVLDGVIYYGTIEDINPHDIESIDVLKDASSAAVFGAKAANGVILITTKKGSGVKPTISFNTNIGLATMGVHQRPLEPDEFLKWRQDVMENIYVNFKPYQFSDPRNLPSDLSINDWLSYTGSTDEPVKEWLRRLNFQNVQINNYLEGNTINWYDDVYQNGLRQDYTVSLSGKKADVSYYMSLQYLENEGIVTGDEFSTVRGRLNVEGKATKFITAGINLQFADRNESSVPANWGRVITNTPFGSKYNNDGTLKWSPDSDEGVLLTANAKNPFLAMEYTDRLFITRTLLSNIYLKGDLPLGFSYQINYAPRYTFEKNFNANSSLNQDYSIIGGTAYRNHREVFNWQIDNIIQWNKTFNDIHRFDLTLLANAEKYQSWASNINNEGFQPNDDLSYHNIGSGTNPVVSSNDEYSTGDAMMARLNYALKNKYLLTTSIRRDGYSAFGQKNPRATFPSIAIGWILSEEKVLESLKWLDFAKIRLSYGINGNRDIGRYLALSDLSSGKYLYASSTSGVPYVVTELFVNRMSNANLSWEETTAYNIGLDLNIFYSRISSSIDLYTKSTRNLLVRRSLPNITGFTSVMDNLGEISNRGLEVRLNTINVDQKNFLWNTSLIFSFNRNKIIHLYGPVNILDDNGNVIGQHEPDDPSNGWFIGHAIDEIWDLKVLGVWQENEKDDANKYGVRPGDFKLEDVNGDHLYTDEDRQFLGYRSPKFQWSLRNDINISKNIDFSFMLYSNWGQLKTFNWAKNSYDGTGNFPERSSNYNLPFWTPENKINDFAANNSSSGGATYNIYRDASFVRLRNIVLAYNFPKKLVNKAHVENLKLSFNVNNVAFYAPTWDFWDPENNGPTPRTYTLGINLTF